MARAKSKKTSTKTKTRKKSVRKTTRTAPKTKANPKKKASTKLFKFKKGKNLIKGLASVAVNAGIQKGMDALFEDRVKKSDYMKKNTAGNEYLDVENYNKAVEQQRTLRAAANVGIWLTGATSTLPKNYVSSEYLEINALEHGVSTFISKSKNEKVQKAASYIQNTDDLLIESESIDHEAIAMIEAADLIEAAEMEEVFIEDFEAENENVAYLNEVTETSTPRRIKKSNPVKEEVTEQIEYDFGFSDIEGMNTVIPGIEEEN